LKNTKPVILTPLDAALSDNEKKLYSKHKPYGFILFQKHCQNPEQLQKLIADLKEVAGEDVIISVDQEGGRVARLKAPNWPEFPAPATMDNVFDTYKSIGQMMAKESFNLDYAPCLDVVPEGAQCDAIGDRCFSSDPQITAEKGIEACKGLLSAGITPVIKHMPGHGRAVEDSHHHLPIVKASEADLFKDLEAFKIICRHPELVSGSKDVVSGLRRNDVFLFAGMTAHVIYECWDKDNPATLSKIIINNIIRNEIGFKGLLFSDDLAMGALESYGTIVERVQLCLEAGCDIAVPCHTSLEESQEILETL
jgi:beta-N-acetylhexosaminidase